MNIHGDIQGSNVAAGGASISDSAATYNNNVELAPNGFSASDG
jgi:hypothetical protein